MPALKNARLEEMCQEYVRGGNQTAAHTKAFGDKHKTPRSSASSRFRQPEVRARVAELQARIAKRAEITQADVIGGLAKIAFGDFRKLYDEEGKLKLPHELDDETTAMIAGYGGGKVKLRDTIAALTAIGKHLGMFAEKHEHSGPDGGPIEISDSELSRLIVFQLTKATKGK